MSRCGGNHTNPITQTPQTGAAPRVTLSRAKYAEDEVSAAIHRKEALAVSRKALKICDVSTEAAVGVIYAILHARNLRKRTFASLVVAFVHDKVHPVGAPAEGSVRKRTEDSGVVLGDNAVDYRRMRGVGNSVLCT